MSDDRAPERCPRCGGAFQCGMHDPTPCACTTVALDSATLAALRERYSGCLCPRCLAVIAREGLAPPQLPCYTDPVSH